MSRFLVGVLLVLGGSPALAAPAPSCEAPHELDKYQLLRRLSLDLRGRVPSVEEYQALDAAPSVPPATVKGYLKGEEFRAAMRGYHERMFWPNITNVQLSAVNALLTLKVGEVAYSLASAARRRTFRGDPDAVSTLGAQCGDYEQTHFLADGLFRPDPAFIHSEVNAGGVTIYQEGWRLVEPYWAPGTQVKVCAFDAQETPSYLAGSKTIGCNETVGNSHKDCGCGPNLKFCYGPNALVQQQILVSAREQLGRSVDEVTVGGKPYSDLLLSTKAYENGALSNWKQTLAPNLSLARIYALPDPLEEVPTKAFTDTTWTQIERGPMHAGVVTLPGYLLRFQTNRGRANRFRIDFECEFFVPPATLTRQDGCKDQGTDLTQRCSCQYCHQTLEPHAAHWGQFAEAGTTLLSNTALFPRINPSCVGSSSAFCSRFYVTAPDADTPGSLISYQYANTAHPEVRANIAAGPRALAQQIIGDGTFDRCAVKKAFSYLVKRDMHTAGDQTDEVDLMTKLASGFGANGRSFPWLIEQVVELPQYRRIR